MTDRERDPQQHEEQELRKVYLRPDHDADVLADQLLKRLALLPEEPEPTKQQPHSGKDVN